MELYNTYDALGLLRDGTYKVFKNIHADTKLKLLDNGYLVGASNDTRVLIDWKDDRAMWTPEISLREELNALIRQERKKARAAPRGERYARKVVLDVFQQWLDNKVFETDD